MITGIPEKFGLPFRRGSQNETMNEQPKTKFYKHWWFLLIAGAILGVALLFVVLLFVAYPQYLSPLYWMNRINHVVPAPVGVSSLVAPDASTAPAYFELRELDDKGNFVHREGGLNSTRLISADVGFDPASGLPFLTMNFDAAGSRLITYITTQNVGKQVGFFVNDKLLYSPTVARAVTGGSLRLSGNMSAEEMINLAKSLNAGRGPAGIHK